MATINLSMSGDSDMLSDFPNFANGAADNMMIGGVIGGGQTTRALVRPDFSTLPAGSIISSATLKVTPIGDFSNNARTLSAYRCLRDWVEAQVTWNAWKTSNNWATAGCGNSTTDYNSTVLGTVAVPANPTLNTALEITLTASTVQGMFDGTYANEGFLLRVDTESEDKVQYASKEHATSGYRPILTVEYTIPSFFLLF